MIFCRRPTECLKFIANISDELLNARTVKAFREHMCEEGLYNS